MGKKKTWKDPKKMDFLFHHLIDERSEIYHNYFLEKLNDFKDRYTVNEINEKLKIVGMKEYILSGFNSDDMEEYFKEYFPVSADSLIKDIQLYRVSTMNDNPDIQSRSIMQEMGLMTGSMIDRLSLMQFWLQMINIYYWVFLNY
jgi:RNA recognition motif-containing protein